MFAVLLIVNEYYFGFINHIEEKAIDKLKHFEAGRIIATFTFLLAYSGIVSRIYLGKTKNIGGAIFWLPTFIFLAIALTMVVVFIFAVAKEAMDSTGLGNVEWEDITATIEGAASMSYGVAILMAITPMLIPAEQVLGLIKMLKSDFTSGHHHVDKFVQAIKKHPTKKGSANILLVEDDIVCATNVLDFCSLCNLSCHQVDTISAAEKYVEIQPDTLQLIILDIFVRVDQDGDVRNGMDFLSDLEKSNPKATRSFKVIILSGHTHMLGEKAELADLFLQKPWNPIELKEKLIEWNIIKNKLGKRS